MIQYSSFQQTLWWYFLTFLASAIGAIGAIRSRYFYNKILNKPSWAPPSWLFGIVWFILYALQAQSSYFIQVSLGGVWGFQLNIFISFLIISTFWVFVFFRWKRIAVSVFVIFVSWVLSVLTTVFYFQEHSLSGWLYLPTCIWVGFATILNYSIYRRNKNNQKLRDYKIHLKNNSGNGLIQSSFNQYLNHNYNNYHHNHHQQQFDPQNNFINSNSNNNTNNFGSVAGNNFDRNNKNNFANNTNKNKKKINFDNEEFILPYNKSNN